VANPRHVWSWSAGTRYDAGLQCNTHDQDLESAEHDNVASDLASSHRGHQQTCLLAGHNMNPQRVAAEVTAVQPSCGRKISTCQAGHHESVCVCVCDSEREKAREKRM